MPKHDNESHHKLSKAFHEDHWKTMGNEDVAICLLCWEATEEVAGCKCGGTMGVHLKWLALWCHSRTTAYIRQVDTINGGQPKILHALRACELWTCWTYCQTCKEPFGFYQLVDLPNILEEMICDLEKYPDVKPLPAHVGKLLSPILYCHTLLAKWPADKADEKKCFEWAVSTAKEVWNEFCCLEENVHLPANIRQAFDQCFALMEYAEEGVKNAFSD